MGVFTESDLDSYNEAVAVATTAAAAQVNSANIAAASAANTANINATNATDLQNDDQAWRTVENAKDRVLKQNLSDRDKNTQKEIVVLQGDIQKDVADRQGAIQATIAGRDNDSRERISTAENAVRREVAGLDQVNRVTIAGLDNDTQRAIAALTTDTQRATSALDNQTRLAVSSAENTTRSAIAVLDSDTSRYGSDRQYDGVALREGGDTTRLATRLNFTSSQFHEALAVAAPYLAGPTSIETPGLQDIGTAPYVSTRPVFTPAQVRQQVALAITQNDARTASQIRAAQGDIAGRGFSSNSPMLDALRSGYQAQALRANVQANVTARLSAAQANADQVRLGQTLAVDRWKAQQQVVLDSEKNAITRRVGLVGGVAGMLGNP